MIEDTLKDAGMKQTDGGYTPSTSSQIFGNSEKEATNNSHIKSIEEVIAIYEEDHDQDVIQNERCTIYESELDLFDKEKGGCIPDRIESLKKSCSSRKSKKKADFSEYDLASILLNNYQFGCYGNALYVRDASGVCSEVTKSVVQKLLVDSLTTKQYPRFKIGKSKAVLEWLQSLSSVRENTLTFKHNKVLFSNGYFDIVEEKPAKMKKNDFILARINAQYLPNQKLKCPYFDAYLESSSGGDKSVQKRICAMLGYLMLSGYPGKHIIVLGTAKNSGKSMIIRFYQRLVGPDMVSGQTPIDITESFALSEFRNKVANVTLDLPAMEIKPRSVGTLKTLSGGDLVSINGKWQDRRSQLCFTKQVIGTNAGITLQQHDEAFWSRVTVIPYPVSIDVDDQIPDLEEKLFKERDAIVTKCMKAARKLIKRKYVFPECALADELKDSWIGWIAYAEEFLRTYCIVEKDAFTSSSRLYSKYVQYCQKNSYPYGEMTGFIRYAKKKFPCNGNFRPSIGGTQQRGLPGVRFLGVTGT